MVRGIEGNEMATPRQPKSTPKPGSSKSQQTLLGFFAKKTPTPASSAALTPAPSSDPVVASSPTDSTSRTRKPMRGKENTHTGLPSPFTPAGTDSHADGPTQDVNAEAAFTSSPLRKAKRPVNYAESDDEEDEEVLKPCSANTSRSSKRRKVIYEDDSDDEFAVDADLQAAMDDEMDDFIVADESEEDVRPTKSKKRSSKVEASTARSSPPATHGYSPINVESLDLPTTSTANQWKFDPEQTTRLLEQTPKTPAKSKSQGKPKAHTTEPEKRYPWLANLQDADRNPVGHHDYDPRTIFIPPLAWSKFSAFEKQYWEIKQKFWDTIVFFKKGKFYELYENDATVGHQLFDLKLTDRVNMRMVGVPEASLDHWATQFVAKGFKIARVDQMESALGKEMRERDDHKKKEEKIIRRELASVLTSGTLVEGGMLQNDLATYCVAIKETEVDDLPAFGVAFVDTATAQFNLVDFVDDADLTKFETLIAQIRPGELLLEKSCLSTRALRILKGNTGPTTLWNWLKPIKEFWPADTTMREIDATGYFPKKEDDDSADTWPLVLREATQKERAMSAMGALIQYLRVLKLDRDLVSLGNITWYDPIRKATTLVLDGQSLINLEIFANSFDGGIEGTLFAMLNRCITPFGKRMLRQWVCHPLADAKRINERLDAVDALNKDATMTDNFCASLSRIPDLERLISRVHAGRCKAQDFVRVIEGFEQIDYTMGILGDLADGNGLVSQLLASMPDLGGALKHWQTAFDKQQAKETGILVPEPGVEEEFDQSADAIAACESALDSLLKKARKDLGSSAICYRDNGKEIYQLEVPIKIKGIPKNWDQMSATAKVKRYYSPELRKLVRELQEARETHAATVKQVAGRFYQRFDEDYPVWLAAVKIIAQLDCLISLSKASTALGSPSCRPTFVDTERPIQNFVNLRHPTMLTTVSDFIPNDVCLGGDEPGITLLTGANAAGKSTVLRMTCIAVILAQLGCYVPCDSATLTPVDRIMSRLGANDNILQQQSTFFVELAETKKILCEATPRSLVILDELGRGTSSVDGLAVAEAVLHHIASSVGCTGFFATHYHALAASFANHPEVTPKRMAIQVDETERRVTFLYKLEQGVAEGSFGMHCASMCGISSQVVDRAEEAAKEWEHSARVGQKLEQNKKTGALGLGWLSDVAWCLRDEGDSEGEVITERALLVLAQAIEAM